MDEIKRKTNGRYKRYLSKPNSYKYRKQFKKFIELQKYVKEDFGEVPDFTQDLERGLLAMDTLTCLSAVRSNADMFAKYLALNLSKIKPGDFMWTFDNQNNLWDVILFQVVELSPIGMLTLRLVQFYKEVGKPNYLNTVYPRRTIPDQYKLMKAGTDITVKMTFSGLFLLHKRHCAPFRFIPSTELSSTSLLSQIEKHPLQDKGIFYNLIKLSVLIHIINNLSWE